MILKNMNKEDFIIALQTNQGIIRKVANSYCKNVSDRDDLIQEITIHLWKSWNKYNGEFKLSTWIYRISLNVAISFYRKNYKKNSLHDSIQEENVFLDDGEDIDLKDNIKALYHFISELDELNKALMLLYLDNYAYEEIAETLGISKTNVATKISRIKDHLTSRFNQ
jgi:RNA polymerase sigma factor (sigma-70 family)